MSKIELERELPPQGDYVATVIAIELKTSKKAGNIYTQITIDIPKLSIEHRTQRFYRRGNVAMEWNFLCQQGVLLHIRLSHRVHENQCYVDTTLRNLTFGPHEPLSLDGV